MANAIEDAVIESRVKLPFKEIDELIKDILDIALKRLPNKAVR